MNKIIKSNKKLEIESIKELEEKYNIILPIQYKNFLLKYNGGYPEFSLFKISEKQREDIVNVFYGVNNEYDNIAQYLDYLEDIIPKEFIPIADDPSGNQICLGISGIYVGKIYFLIHDMYSDEKMDSLIFLANSFDEFFHNLY